MNDTTYCRVCATELSEDKLDFTEDNKLLKQINKLLPVVVMSWDPLSHTICRSCVAKLDLFEQFYDNSLKVEHFLKKKLNFPVTYQTQVLNPELKIGPFTIIHGHNIKHLISSVAPPETSTVRKVKSMEPILNEQNSINMTDSSNNVHTSPAESNLSTNFHVTELDKYQSLFTCKHCSVTYTSVTSALNHQCLLCDLTNGVDDSSVLNLDEASSSTTCESVSVITEENGHRKRKKRNTGETSKKEKRKRLHDELVLSDCSQVNTKTKELEKKTNNENHIFQVILIED